MELDDGTARAAEHGAAVLHHRALAVVVGKNISTGFKICLVDSVPPSTSPDSGPVTISYTEVQINFLSMTYDTIGQRQTPESGFFRAPPL